MYANAREDARASHPQSAAAEVDALDNTRRAKEAPGAGANENASGG